MPNTIIALVKIFLIQIYSPSPGVNSGGSDDWVKGYVGVKYCYTVELPGGGAHGFDLPPSRIRPVVEEIFQGIQVFAKFIEREFSP